eukprot:Gb_03383 [translate_table: standard]
MEKEALTPCGKEIRSEVESPSGVNKVENTEVTPERIMDEEERVGCELTERNGDHHNLLARRIKEEGKRVTPPDPVQVPLMKIVGFTERYRSPTDSIMSPVSRGLLARNGRSVGPLPPYVPPKALDTTFQDAGPSPL